IDTFLDCAWESGLGSGINDFEEPVFREHPRVKAIKRKLIKAGSSKAMLSGSGSSLYGVFGERAQIARAVKGFQKETVFPVSLVSRSRYQSLWRRWLQAHGIQSRWPPQSRYA